MKPNPIAMLVGLMACASPTSTVSESPTIVRVGFDCADTVVEGDVIRCVDCGRAWGVEPTGATREPE